MSRDHRKNIWLAIIGALFVFILIYIIFVSRSIIFGVKIKNVNIKDGDTYKESIIDISGNAKNAIYVGINDNEVAINQDGDFKEAVALSLGYNIITITAKDKFGHDDEKNYQLIYAPEDLTSQAENKNDQEEN